MYEPFHKLKYSYAATYYDQMRNAVPKLVKEKGAKKVCTMYQDDDFGQEVLKGGEAGLKTVNMEFAEKTSYKRGATDFSSQVQKMQASEASEGSIPAKCLKLYSKAAGGLIGSWPLPMAISAPLVVKPLA